MCPHPCVNREKEKNGNRKEKRHRGRKRKKGTKLSFPFAVLLPVPRINMEHIIVIQ